MEKTLRMRCDQVVGIKQGDAEKRNQIAQNIPYDAVEIDKAKAVDLEIEKIQDKLQQLSVGLFLKEQL